MICDCTTSSKYDTGWELWKYYYYSLRPSALVATCLQAQQLVLFEMRSVRHGSHRHSGWAPPHVVAHDVFSWKVVLSVLLVFVLCRWCFGFGNLCVCVFVRCERKNIKRTTTKFSVQLVPISRNIVDGWKAFVIMPVVQPKCMRTKKSPTSCCYL